MCVASQSVIQAVVMRMQVPAVSSKDSETVPVNGLVTDSADSMDVSRRQSVRSTLAQPCCSLLHAFVSACSCLTAAILWGARSPFPCSQRSAVIPSRNIICADNSLCRVDLSKVQRVAQGLKSLKLWGLRMTQAVISTDDFPAWTHYAPPLLCLSRSLK